MKTNTNNFGSEQFTTKWKWIILNEIIYNIDAKNEEKNELMYEK